MAHGPFVLTVPGSVPSRLPGRQKRDRGAMIEAALDPTGLDLTGSYGPALLGWIALVLAGLLAVVAGVLFRLGDAAGRRRLGQLCDRTRAAQVPAALATVEGQVLALSDALRRRATRPAGRVVADVLGAAYPRVGAAEIYRMSRAARESGFATLQISEPGGGRIGHLTVTEPESDILLWRVLDADAFARSCAAADMSAYQAAPFAHMRRCADGRAVVNALFHRLFGSNPAPVVAALPHGEAALGDRVLLTGRDGKLRNFRAFSIAAEGARPTGAPPLMAEGDELFLFPIGDPQGAVGGVARVLETVPVALAQFETDGTLLWLNAQARAILGPHGEIGRRLESMFVPLGPPLRAVDVDDRGPAPYRGQMAQLRGSDTFLQVALTRAEVDERETMLAVLTDASQLRQLEDQFAQSQKMEAVGKLAGGVAHDFNNVLTAIVGHCDLLLLRKDASHPDYSDLIQITQNANRAAALVRQLLAFSRKQTLNPEVLSVQDVVSETHYLLNRLLGESVALQLEVGPEIWSVRADHQQLEQVLMNLVVNARDAMAGSGTVSISVANVSLRADPELPEAQRPEGEFVEILVRDTGPGIDPAVIDKVFDPFFTTKSKGEGTGLGLSTVYGIVKQSGGFIFASNLEGSGACFRILLPRARVAQPTAPALPPPEAARRDLTGKGSVLLVEDEDPVRAFAARALKLRGYEVAEAATAEDAMAILEDEDYRVDLLVSDVVMPGMDGPTFATLARKMRPGLRLIFVSGYAEESFRKNLTETDFMFLAKPFSLNELTGKVKEALGEGLGA